MSYIKKFIERVSSAEGRHSREVVLPLSEAKELRDEITKLLIDQRNQNQSDEVISVVVNGGKW